MSEKDIKRAKQAAYAQALQQQQLHSQQASSEKAGRARGNSLSPDRRQDYSPNNGSGNVRKNVGGGGLEEGWVIGPLG